MKNVSTFIYQFYFFQEVKLWNMNGVLHVFLNLTISCLNTYLTHFINCRKLLTFLRMSYCNDKLSFASLSEYNYFTNVFSCIKHYSNELHICNTSSDISNELKQRNHLTVCIYYFH